MNEHEATNAYFITFPIWSCGRQFAVAASEDETGYIWFHVVEQQEDNTWISVYRACDQADAEDVLLSFELNSVELAEAS